MNTKGQLRRICGGSPPPAFSIAAILAATAATIMYIMGNAAWLIGDQYSFLLTTALGKSMPIYMNMNRSGRFFPLGHFEFNVLPLAGARSAEAHFMVLAAEYIISIALILLVCGETSRRENLGFSWIATLAALSVFNASGLFLFVFSDIIYAERILTPLLLGFSLFYLKALGGGRRRDYWIALACAIYATYCKEPVFGIFWVIAGTNLIFNYNNLSSRDRWFNWALVANGVVYLLLYYFVVFLGTDDFYGGFVVEDRLLIIGKLFAADNMFAIYAALAIARGYIAMFRKERLMSHDGPLFAGIAYSAFYVAIKYTNLYYFLPTIALCLPALYYWIAWLDERKRVAAYTAAGAIIAAAAWPLALHPARWFADYRYMAARNEEERAVVPQITEALGNGGEIIITERERTQEKIAGHIMPYFEFTTGGKPALRASKLSDMEYKSGDIILRDCSIGMEAYCRYGFEENLFFGSPRLEYIGRIFWGEFEAWRAI